MKNSKLVCSVGVNDKKYPSNVGGKSTKEYDLWKNTLKRCYCPKYQAKKPTYIGCSVSDNFKHYSYFYDWCHKQIGFNKNGTGLRKWNLDKDILVPDNKMYSEDVCVFVPHEINSFFVDRGNARGEYPLGVCFNKRAGKFVARCWANGKKQHLGYFNTAEEAHATYKTLKEALCKELANKWRGQIDERVYDAMMNWVV